MKHKRLHSRIYDCNVLHTRTHPILHKFRYSYFVFCLDLDEIQALSNNLLLFGASRFRFCRFLTRDFIFGRSSHSVPQMKTEIISYAKAKGVLDPILRVEVVAQMRTLGWSFNPATFYFCYGEGNEVLCSIVEVTNTFFERKTFFLKKVKNADKFIETQKKNFYVSPFVEADSDFEFRISAPSDHLNIRIDSKNADRILVHAQLNGSSVNLNDRNLFIRLLKYPITGLSVFLKIHLQAIFLYFKKIPFFKKNEKSNLQISGLS